MHDPKKFPDIDLWISQLRESLGASAVFVSRIDTDKQIVLAAALNDPSQPAPKEFNLDQSICCHVHGMEFPLIVDDAPSHPLVSNNPLVRANAVGAYAGYPILDDNKKVVAVLCAVFDRMHVFLDEEKDQMERCANDLSAVFSAVV